MATKDINFDIKVNGKQLDLAKISFKDFDKVVKEAKKDLQALPLNDPRYKVLNAEIKAADKAWKEARKSVGDFDKELEDGETTVKSYRTQIADLIKVQIALEAQGQKNSQQYADNEKKIKGLRDAQEQLVRSTQDLDDTLAQIPGPIGMIGQGLQTFESVSQNASSAFKSLGLGFSSFDKIVKTSLVGFLVGLLVTLVSAVMDAAKSFKPLQNAFAAVGDAVGALFNALKPVTDFILNVVVGALNILAGAINAVASAFGGVNNGAKQMSLELERSIDRQKKTLDNYSSFLSEHYRGLLELQQKYNEKRKAVLDDEKMSVDDKNTEILELDALYFIEKDLLQKKYDKIKRDRDIELTKLDKENTLKGIDNERYTQKQTLEIQKATEEELANSEIKGANGRIIRMMVLQKQIQAIANQGSDEERKRRAETIAALNQSIDDEKENVKYLEDQKVKIKASSNAELQKLSRQFFREDIAAINERSNQILQLGTELIKEENARNLKAANDALIILKEQHRKEIEDVALAGGTTKKLKEKQAAEEKVLLEKKRLAQVQFDSYIIQLEIDRNNRLVTETGKGTQEYFNARRNVIDKELQQELLLADGNANKVENARTNHWKKLFELDKEGLNNQLEVLNKQLETEYDNSQAYFNKQRDIEVKNYELQQKEYQNNFDMLEILKKEHDKRMNMIDVAQLNNASDYFSRRAETEKKQYGEMFKDLELAEEMSYQARLKAAGDNAVEIEIIEREHTQRLKDLQNQKIQAYASVATAMMDSFANVTSALAAFYEFESQNTEKSMADRKKAFEQNKKYQIATAALSAASGIIQILTQPSTLPSPFDWIVKIANAAALGIMTAVQISKIKATEFNASGSGGSAQQGNTLGRNYGDGGMIDGPSHKSAAGGVMINAEGGEAVMTRGAVSMFGPMLSAMNQYGGGASFIPGAAGSSRFDNPSVQNVAQDRQPLVMKTYVVSSDMTSEMEKQARLKDLSTL
jgi:hypothetical protein